MLANDGGLEEVVVTARKREENLQNVSMSISAISAAEIEKLGVELEAQTAKLRETEASLEELRQRHHAAGDAVHDAQGQLYETNAEFARIEQQIQHVRENRQRIEARLADLRSLADALGKQILTIEANANDEGHLYGSVGATEIVNALKKLEFTITSDQVRLKGPLKELGLYTVNIHLGHEIESDLKVWVVPSTGDEERVAEKAEKAAEKPAEKK